MRVIKVPDQRAVERGHRPRPRVLRVTRSDSGGAPHVGHPLLDEYLRFVAARARPNTALAAAYDIKVAFTVLVKDPRNVTTTDVLTFIEAQRKPRSGSVLVRLEDGESGLSARTIKRRLATLSGLFGYLLARGEVSANPVPHGLATRHRSRRGSPLIRTPQTLPRVLSPDQITALLQNLRTVRDLAMVEAMVFGGLRRVEVLGLRLGDLRLGENRVFVAEGKGGHQRLVPIAPRFFASVGEYLQKERPRVSTTDRVFVVLKGPHRGLPLTAEGLDEVFDAARRRAGLEHATCHQLRHTCLTRLREAGMALEAVQAQAGHRSIESTRIYLHLADNWLADQYRQAMEEIEAQVLLEAPR